MTRTARVPRLAAMHQEPVLEINPADATPLGVEDGGLASITSRRASITARVDITERIRRGTVFLPMHWGFMQEQACEANALMHEQACPISGQPELKATAVCVAAAVSVIRPVEREPQRPERIPWLQRIGLGAQRSTSSKAARRL
jgi:ferredoxin-nitrate reductase